MAIFNSIKYYYEKIVRIGFDEQMSSSDMLRLQLINQFASIVIVAAFTYLLISIPIRYDFYDILYTSTWLTIMLVTLILNHFKRSNSAKFIFLISTLLLTTFLHFVYNHEYTGMETAFLSLILLALFLLSRKQAYAYIIITVACYLFIGSLDSLLPYPSQTFYITRFAYFFSAIAVCTTILSKYTIEKQKQIGTTIKLNNKLIANQKQLERFNFIASHDLRSPIRNVISFSDLTHRQIKKGDKQKTSEYLSYIKSSAYQMDRLLNDILELSEIDAQKVGDFNCETLDLNGIVEHTKDKLKNLIQEQNAKIIAEELSSCYANKKHFITIFEQIIDNGIRYNNSHQAVVKVWTTSDEKGLSIHFQDNGIGIEKAYQNQIFSYFKRLHPPDKYPGSGIGLGLCNKIISLYNGHIDLNSELDHGSTFSVFLPHKKVDQNN